MIYTTLYCIGAASTFGVVHAANKPVGTPIIYALAASVFWPVWWFFYTIGDVH